MQDDRLIKQAVFGIMDGKNKKKKDPEEDGQTT